MNPFSNNANNENQYAFDYINYVNSSRDTFNNIISIIRQQDIAMQSILLNSINRTQRNRPRRYINDDYSNIYGSSDRGFDSASWARPRARRGLYNYNPTNINATTNNSTNTASASTNTTRNLNSQSSSNTTASDWGNAVANALSLFSLGATNSLQRTIPTQLQINSATEEIVFSEIAEPSNTTCPITHEPFSPNDSVLRIRHCQHIFTPNALRRWFETSSLCPMCRHNIISQETTTTATATSPNVNVSSRTSELPQTTSAPQRTLRTTFSNQTDFMNNLSSLITNDLLNQLDSNGFDSSNNIVFEYALLNNNDIQDTNATNATNATHDSSANSTTDASANREIIQNNSTNIHDRI